MFQLNLQELQRYLYMKRKFVFYLTITLGLIWSIYYYFFSFFFTPSVQEVKDVFTQTITRGSTVEQIKVGIDKINQKYHWNITYFYPRTAERGSYAVMDTGYFLLIKTGIVIDLNLNQQDKLETINVHPVGNYL